MRYALWLAISITFAVLVALLVARALTRRMLQHEVMTTEEPACVVCNEPCAPSSLRCLACELDQEPSAAGPLFVTRPTIPQQRVALARLQTHSIVLIAAVNVDGFARRL